VARGPIEGCGDFMDKQERKTVLDIEILALAISVPL
jgi:hypothetical protein